MRSATVSQARRLVHLLPEGRPLPEAIWRQRHRGMIHTLALHVVGLTALGAYLGAGPVSGVLAVGPLVVAAAVGLSPRVSRRLRTSAVTLGLLGCSAALVHLTGGATESYLHFFLTLAIIALYQEWLPLMLAVGFVSVHHTLALLVRGSLADHAGETLAWALVHGLYVTAVSVAGILGWRLGEQERERSERILNSTAEGIYGVDLDGTVIFANRAMARLLGRRVPEIVGRPAHDVCGHPPADESPCGVAGPCGSACGPGDGHDGCPVCTAMLAADGLPCAGTRFHRANGSVFPVEFTSVPLVERGNRVGAVVTFRDLTEHEQLTERALRDSLTGLPNRALFMDHLEHALARLDRNHQMVAVLFVDLDRFKVVNDSLGHAAGDELLIAAAERLRASIRGHDTVARFGGDEFVVLCENLDAERDVLTVAERIVASFTEPFRVHGTDVSAHASVGISVTRDPKLDADSLVCDADSAMYRAKELGRSRYELFDPDMRTRAMQRLQTESALWRAIAHNELRVHYQPKVNLVDGRVIGMEALVRWQHPEHGLLPPADFIPLAEETGLIVPIGAWVLEEACRQMQQWRLIDERLTTALLSVNLSARQLSEPGFVRAVAEILERTETPADLLCLEVTETVLMHDVHSTIDVLQGLKNLGVSIAVDDFGTGYSSLSYLSRFPVDMLKVDRAFVRDISAREETWPIVAAVIGLSKALGLSTVAEGVERDEQAVALRELGCELAQGFHFARPQPPEVLDELVASGRPLVAGVVTGEILLPEPQLPA